MAFVRYLRDHLIGDLSLATSVLVNGVLVYLALVVIMGVIGALTGSETVLFAGLAIFFAWAVWWCVGAIASALKNYRSTESSILQRVLAISVVIAVVVFAAFIANDFAMLVL